jgi:hypothetical protein
MLDALAALLVLTLAPQEEPPQAVDPKRIEAALEDLDRAFDKGSAEDRVAALSRSGSVPDPDVVDRVERGLRDHEPAVRDAAIGVLRFQEHPSALKALEASYRRDGKRFRKDDVAVYTALIKAIGQHGDVRSIDLLTDDVWEVQDHSVIQARIFSLGNVRDVKSVEALFSLMKSGGRDRIQPFMGELRMALVVLTGVDQGESQDLWIAWWNDSKRGLEISPGLPKLPKQVAQRWASYWGEGRIDERGTKRRDRGRD